MERQLGARLPSDYMDLAQTFGPGMFGEVDFYTPTTDANSGLVAFAGTIAEMQRDAREEFRDGFPIFPEDDGALAWGRTPDALQLCWKTDGQADAWPIVVIPGRGGLPGDFSLFRGSVSQFLLDYMCGGIDLPHLGTPPAEKTFLPD